MEIRKITEKDINQLEKIGKQTFFETFSCENSEENMIEYLEKGFSKEKLIRELNNKCSHFYFAEYEGEVVGYLKINFDYAQTEIKDKNAIEIERIYVLNDFQGKGVGQKLYNRAIEIAKNNRLHYIWLGVWEHNTNAIQFYQKNGFTAFDKHSFKLGDDEQTDILMRIYIEGNRL